LKAHIYNWRHIVIGGNFNALSYAHKKSHHIVRNTVDPVFPFDASSHEASVGLNTATEKYRRLMYDMQLRGLSPIARPVNSVKVNLDKGMLTVYSSNNNSIVEACFEKLYIFDTERVTGIPVSPPDPKSYMVYDWYNVNSGMKHDYDLLEYDTDFVRRIYFHVSPRIDGNKSLKDLVVESCLTNEQINDINYSDSISRLVTLGVMKKLNISQPKISLRKRDVVPVKEEVFYEFSSGRNNTNT
tara:strand:+ start:9389 stop:10114 length:726 start_codon:yes stop_codon:yes gene_type:complete